MTAGARLRRAFSVQRLKLSTSSLKSSEFVDLSGLKFKLNFFDVLSFYPNSHENHGEIPRAYLIFETLLDNCEMRPFIELDLLILASELFEGVVEDDTEFAL